MVMNPHPTDERDRAEAEELARKIKAEIGRVGGVQNCHLWAPIIASTLQSARAKARKEALEEAIIAIGDYLIGTPFVGNAQATLQALIDKGQP